MSGNLNQRMNELTPSDPAIGAVAITGSTQNLATSARGLLITTTGNIAFTMQDGSSVTWNSIPVGVYPLTVKSITTGATAAGYVLL